MSAEQAKLPVNQQQLKAAWDCSNVSARTEWLEWQKRLGNELMRESPSQAIRASRNLAENHPPFAKELFNVAFVSCWTELYESYQVGDLAWEEPTQADGQEDLVHNLEQAMTTPGVPSDIVNMVLNLAEFMEHDDKPLALEARLLGDYVSGFDLLILPRLISGDHVPRLRQSSSLQGNGILRGRFCGRRRGPHWRQPEATAE